MDIAPLIPPAGRSAAQPNSSLLNEPGQFQQPAQSGTFSSLLKDAVKNTDDEQTSSLSNADGPIESAPSTVAGDHATGAALTGVVVASFFQVPDSHEVASPVADKTESLQISTGCNPEGTESIPLLPQGLTVVTAHDDVTLGEVPMPANSPQAKTADSSINALPQPALGHDQSSETSAIQEDSGGTGEPAIRSGHGAPANLAPVILKEPPGISVLPGTPSLGPLTSDQRPSPAIENQGRHDLLPAGYMHGNVQSVDRSSAIIQEQGAQEATLLGQTLSARVIGGSGGGDQDPFGASAQEEGGGTLFQSSASGVPESVIRGTQSSLFNDQFMSARHAQSSSQGAGTSVATPTAEHHKLTQAFLGEDYSATMTPARGSVQTVQVDLPSHDSGPLSVRISMTDQTVHTQFTTDRSDLGALLFTRQDQLQQSLTKSGLELGQFQVHVGREGQQEALPDRQPRRNDGASEQDLTSQDQNRQTQDRERPNHRPSRTLSLFA